MSSAFELLERIHKDYKGLEKCDILDKNGNKLNPEVKEMGDDKKKNSANTFSSNLSDIPKLYNKTNSVVRDINPLNELSFLQISYSGYEYLLTKDEDLYVFTAINTDKAK
jgi:hypothetical protein